MVNVIDFTFLSRLSIVWNAVPNAVKVLRGATLLEKSHIIVHQINWLVFGAILLMKTFCVCFTRFVLGDMLKDNPPH